MYNNNLSEEQKNAIADAINKDLFLALTRRTSSSENNDKKPVTPPFTICITPPPPHKPR